MVEDGNEEVDVLAALNDLGAGRNLTIGKGERISVMTSAVAKKAAEKEAKVWILNYFHFMNKYLYLVHILFLCLGAGPERAG